MQTRQHKNYTEAHRYLQTQRGNVSHVIIFLFEEKIRKLVGDLADLRFIHAADQRSHAEKIKEEFL